MDFPDTVGVAFVDLLGKSVCRQRVGLARSLTIGFGNKVPRNTKLKLNDAFRGEWELGTFSADWQICYKNETLCSSKDYVESLAELDNKLNSITLGYFESIEQVSLKHIRVNLSSSISIDFSPSHDPADGELFHVFAPNNVYISCNAHNAWKVEHSNRTDIPN